jgi:surface antigen-like variable number repeat protein
LNKIKIGIEIRGKIKVKSRGRGRPRHIDSFCEEVVEGFYGGEFVVFNVEDGVELGDVEDVVDLLGEVEELEFASGVADGGEAADEFSDAGAVDIVDAGKVKNDLLLAFGDQGADGVAKMADFLAEDDAPVDVEDGDVSDFAGINLQGHGFVIAMRPMAGMVVGAEGQVNGAWRAGASWATCGVGLESGKIESPGKLRLRRAAMRSQWVRVLCGLACLSVMARAQCAKDHREDKKGGILVTDFTITGTQTVSATELARMTGELTGNCFNEDSDEMGERVRALFQDRGYFLVEMKSVKLKTGDPLGTPKPVTMEAEVAEGPKYKVGAITFVKNRAFTAERLRSEFPLKGGAVFERGKVASGLESLRKVYARSGYLDYLCIPETTPGSNATMDLSLTVEEGPQYRLDKVEFVGKKEMISRLQVQWKLAEGSVYDANYVDDYMERNREFLPEGFGRKDVQIATDCPKALVAVRLVVDPAEDASRSQAKDVPCEESHDQAK